MTDNDDKKLTPDIRYHLIKKMERHKVIALAGTLLLEHEAKYLEFHGVSGVVLFQRNVESLSQVGDLIAGVTERLAASGLPPLVMADHEGDFVSELKKIIGVPPSALAIAATGDLDLARDVACETGLAMKKLGVNVVLAPVADCFLDLSSPVTGLRTFGRSPESVAEFVASTISGYHESGIIACVKHFPGHGCTPEDSHDTLPEVSKPLEEIRREDLVPFRRAIDQGAEMVMISHVAYSMGGEALVPASFDPRVMKDLLRKEVGFGGVVITDSLEMAGARWYARGQFGEGRGGFERSLLAGADLLMHTKPVPDAVEVEGSNEPLVSIDVMKTIVRTLEKVVDRGRIDEKIAEAAEGNETLRNFLAVLDKSYERVADLRRKVAEQMAAKPRPARHGKVIQFDAYPSVPGVYRDVAERSIAVREGEFGKDIVAPGGHYVVVPVESPASPSLKKQDMDAFVDVLCRHFPHWRRTDVISGFATGEDGELYPEVQSGPQVIDATRFTGQESYGFHVTGDEDVIVAFSCRGYPQEPFLEHLASFVDRLEPAAVLVLGWPVLDWIPEASATVLCYGGSSHVASAVARLLAGEIEPQGKIQGLWPV